MNGHARDENLTCSHCNKYFSNRGALETHTKFADMWSCPLFRLDINDPEDGFNTDLRLSIMAVEVVHEWPRLWRILFGANELPLTSSRSP